MSERDSVNDGVTFIELIDRETEHELDPGIRLFDTTTTDTEVFINEDGGILSPRVENAIEDLDAGWGFHRDIATVSGRVYLVDRVLKDHMSELWGAPSTDQDGELYYMVDDVDLRSQGIVRGPHDYAFDSEPAVRNRVRFGYGFSLPQDDFGMHQFVLYPGEASKHVYGTPSPEAIDLRLHRDFPQVMEYVDKFIKEGEREATKLPKRLELLTRRIQAELVASDDLREWLASYLDQRIAFDQRWSIALTMQGPLTFIDEDGDALSLDIRSEHTEHCFAPEVAFIMRGTSDEPVVHAAFIADLPHPSDENYTDKAIIPVTSIRSLRNTRRVTRLVDIAMNAKYAAEPEVQSTDVEQIPEQVTHALEPTEQIARLRKYQDALDATIKETRRLRRMTFLSEEAAQMACHKLCDDLSAKLQEIAAHTMVVYVRGPSVHIPNFELKVHDDKSGVGLKMHPDMPVISPNAVGEFAGVLDGIYMGVDEIEHEDGTTYRPIPKLTFLIDEMPIALAHMPMATIEGHLKRKAVVRMDDFEALKVAQLEQVDDFRDVKREFDRNHPKHRLGRLINTLGRMETALARENTGQFSALRDVSTLRAIGRAISADPVAGGEALTVLSKMLKLSTAKVTGHVHHEERMIPDYELGGTIEAFVPHVPGVPESGPALVMHVRQEPGQPVYYIPLGSVTSFLY